jgi:dihydrofolate reductase
VVDSAEQTSSFTPAVDPAEQTWPSTRALTIAEAKAQQGQDLVAIGSARLAQSLVQRGLVDDYWLFINPIILGGGMSLFSERDEAQKLELVDTRRFGGGVVSLRYGLAQID